MSKKRKHKKMLRAAAKATRWVRDIAATKFDAEAERRYRTKRLGTFGAASEVRHIAPSEERAA